ncbi:MAG TPA: hypothetical protein VK092_05145 [Deinococcales bacterium]|nr:hypothetical protein [Deinococcales bacterium]
MIVPIMFMFSQSLAALPALSQGTTIMVVADDLRTIYSQGTVDGDTLRFDAPLPAGAAVQLLFYPPAADDPAAELESAGQPGDGVQSLRASTDSDGTDLVVLGDDSGVSFRDWLADSRGITLVVPGD